MGWSVGVTPRELARDRRLVARLLVRVVLAGAALLSGAALAGGGPVPVLGGVEPGIEGALAWSLAGGHVVLGVGLLVPAARRVAVAGLVATLLGWMAFLGATSRYLPAFVVGILVMLALRAAPAEDEGTWTLRPRPWTAEAAWLAYVVGMAFFARFLLGGTAFVALTVVGAVLHTRALRRLKDPRAPAAVLLLWVLLFWVGFGGLWSGLGHTVRADEVAAFIGWLAGSPFRLELAAYHLAFGVLGLAAFWIRGNVWTGIVVAKASLGLGAAAVHVADLLGSGNTSSGNAGLPVLVLGDLVMPTVMLVLAWRFFRSRGRRPGPSR